MVLAARPIEPQVSRGASRQLALPSSLLQLNDLRRLFRLLEQKAAEAAERQVATLVLQPGQTPAQLGEIQATVRSSLALVVRLQTATEWVNGTTIDLLGDEQLPDGITKICSSFGSESRSEAGYT